VDFGFAREQTDSGSCLSYVKFEQQSTHNSNMLGAAMLARTAGFTKNSTYVQVAREAMRYSCSKQLSNGAWYYGEATNKRWIDNFHTGYNLDSLKCYIEKTGDDSFYEHLRRGFKYYMDTFFESNGRPKILPQSDISLRYSMCFPSDRFSGKVLGLRCNIARSGYKGGKLDDDGNARRKRLLLLQAVSPKVKAKIPMFHWGQATTYKALATAFTAT